MSDVLYAGANDDVFWPPTDRTEAQAADVASSADAWMYSFLGSRVFSVPASQDRVVVYTSNRFPVDVWAQGGRVLDPLMLTRLPEGWTPRPMTMCVVVQPRQSDSGHETALTGPTEDPPSELPSAVSQEATVEAALKDITRWLGLSDVQIAGATGIDRSTLWRLRSKGATARPATEAPVWRLHALAAAAARLLEPAGAKSWLHAGEPSPAALLSDGKLAEVERQLDQVLFTGNNPQTTFAAVADDDYETDAHDSSTTTPIARGARRARRAPRPT